MKKKEWLDTTLKKKWDYMDLVIIKGRKYVLKLE